MFHVLKEFGEFWPTETSKLLTFPSRRFTFAPERPPPLWTTRSRKPDPVLPASSSVSSGRPRLAARPPRPCEDELLRETAPRLRHREVIRIRRYRRWSGPLRILTCRFSKTKRTIFCFGAANERSLCVSFCRSTWVEDSKLACSSSRTMTG